MLSFCLFSLLYHIGNHRTSVGKYKCLEKIINCEQQMLLILFSIRCHTVTTIQLKRVYDVREND